MMNAERKARKLDDSKLQELLVQLVGEDVAASSAGQACLGLMILLTLGWIIFMSVVGIVSAMIFLALLAVAVAIWYLAFKLFRFVAAYPLQAILIAALVLLIYICKVHV